MAKAPPQMPQRQRALQYPAASAAAAVRVEAAVVAVAVVTAVATAALVAVLAVVMLDARWQPGVVLSGQPPCCAPAAPTRPPVL